MRLGDFNWHAGVLSHCVASVTLGVLIMLPRRPQPVSRKISQGRAYRGMDRKKARVTVKAIFNLGVAASLLVATGSVSAVRAQSYSIDWSTIGGGGGVSTGGVYQVNGTIGQPDVGAAMTGGNYSVSGGFWSLTAAVQTPGAPLLTITLTHTNTAVISWPSPSTGFALQQNSNAGTTSWTDAGLSPSDNGTTKSVVVPASPGSKFYRLKK